MKKPPVLSFKVFVTPGGDYLNESLISKGVYGSDRPILHSMDYSLQNALDGLDLYINIPKFDISKAAANLKTCTIQIVTLTPQP